MTLDQPSGLEEAVTSSEAGGHWVVYGSSQGERSHPITDDVVPWWHLVTPMTDGGAE